MKVYVNRTIEADTVSLFCVKTGKLVCHIPSSCLDMMKPIQGGVFEITRKKMNEIIEKSQRSYVTLDLLSVQIHKYRQQIRQSGANNNN